MNYLAMGPYCWGKGKTRDEAVKLAKQNWVTIYTGIRRPTLKHFSIYASDGEFTVDGMGTIHSTSTIEKLQTSTLANLGTHTDRAPWTRPTKTGGHP